MKSCKHKKRLQIYLDGWMDDSEASRFEKHLKKCPICQSEMLELEEVSSAALEIVDEAPEKGYWDSFFIRAQNRINARNITPYENPDDSRKGLRLKVGAYSLAIVTLAAVILLTMSYLPGVLNLLSEKNLSQETLLEQAEPVMVSVPVENTQSIEPAPDIEAVTGKPEEEPIPAEAEEGKDDYLSPESEKAEELVQSPVKDEVILAYFDDDIETVAPPPILSEIRGFSLQPAKTEFDKINEDYRLSSSMIAAGILSELNGEGDNAGPLNGKIDFADSENSIESVVDRVSSNWGYLSMPQDSGNTEELHRYLIELELIETK